MGQFNLSDIVLPVYSGEFWNTKKTYVICKGSRGSGKSKAAALWHIYNMMRYPLSNTLVVRKVEKTLRDSCFSDLNWAARRLGSGKFWRSTLTPLEMSFSPTGQKILFRGIDDSLKITSISVPYGVLNFLWFEEFFEIQNENDFNIIDESIRGVLPDGYFKRVTATFNPWSETHFSKKRFFDNPADNVLAMTTTYLDNPYLSPADIKLFDDMRVSNPKRFRVAGLGEWGISDGLIFDNFSKELFDINKIRSSPNISSAFGLDFGYTNDPTALFCGLIDLNSKTVWVFDEIYEKALSNEKIAEKIRQKGYAKEKIIADAAEPKSIDRLRELGISRIRPARKGKDSINAGIDFIREFHIVIHPRCSNFFTEINNYSWDSDSSGKKINRPADDSNHLMDAMRYALEGFSVKRAFDFD